MSNAINPPWEVSFERVTPESAAEYLKTQIESTGGGSFRGQRKAALSRIARYVDDIERGYWSVTHQGIAFDEEGRLFDGQHRLRAIVEAGQAADLMVNRGVPRETFWLVDGGLSRSTQSFLDGNNASLRAALARTVMTLEQNAMIARASNITTGAYPSHRILRFVEENHALREYGETFASAARKATLSGHSGSFRGITAAGLLVAGWVAGRHQEWWDDIAVAAGGSVSELEDGSPIRALWKAGPLDGRTSMSTMRGLYVGKKFRDREPLSLLRASNYAVVKL